MGEVIKFPLEPEEGRSRIGQIVHEIQMQNTGQEDQANLELDLFEHNIETIIRSSTENSRYFGVSMSVPGMGMHASVFMQKNWGTLVLRTENEGVLETYWQEDCFPNIIYFSNTVSSYHRIKRFPENELTNPHTIFRINQILEDIKKEIDQGKTICLEKFAFRHVRRHLSLVGPKID